MKLKLRSFKCRKRLSQGCFSSTPVALKQSPLIRGEKSEEHKSCIEMAEFREFHEDGGALDDGLPSGAPPQQYGAALDSAQYDSEDSTQALQDARRENETLKQQVLLLQQQLEEATQNNPDEGESSRIEIEELNNQLNFKNKKIKALEAQLAERCQQAEEESDRHNEAMRVESDSHQQKVSALEAELEQLRANVRAGGDGSALTSAEDETRQLKQRLSEMQDQLAQALAKAASSSPPREENSEMQQQLAQYVEELSSAREEMTTMSEQLNSKNKRIQALEAQMAARCQQAEEESERHNEAMRAESDSHQQKMSALEAELEQLRANVRAGDGSALTSAEDETRQLKQRLSEMQDQLAQALAKAASSSPPREENSEMQQQLAQYVEELSSAREEMTTMSEQLNSKNKRIQALEAQMAARCQQAEEESERHNEAMRAESDSHQQKVSALEAELEQLRANVRAGDGSALTSAEDETRHLKQRLSEMQDQLAQALAKAASSSPPREENSEMQQQLAQYVEELSSAREEMTTMSEQLNSKNKRIQALEAQMAARCQQTEEESDRHNEAMRAESDSHQQKVSALEAELEQLRANVRAGGDGSALTSAEDETRQLKQRLSEMQDQLAQALAKAASSSPPREENSEMQQQLAQYVEELSSAREEMTTMSEQLNKQNKKIQTLEAQMAARCQQAEEESERHNEAMRAESDSHQQKMSALEAELEHLHKNNLDLCGDLKTVESARNALIAQLQECEKRLEETQEKCNGALASTQEECSRAVCSIQEESRVAIEKLEGVAAQLREELSQCNADRLSAKRELETLVREELVPLRDKNSSLALRLSALCPSEAQIANGPKLRVTVVLQVAASRRDLLLPVSLAATVGNAKDMAIARAIRQQILSSDTQLQDYSTTSHMTLDNGMLLYEDDSLEDVGVKNGDKLILSLEREAPMAIQPKLQPLPTPATTALPTTEKKAPEETLKAIEDRLEGEVCVDLLERQSMERRLMEEYYRMETESLAQQERRERVNVAKEDLRNVRARLVDRSTYCLDDVQRTIARTALFELNKSLDNFEETVESLIAARRHAEAALGAVQSREGEDERVGLMEDAMKQEQQRKNVALGDLKELAEKIEFRLRIPSSLFNQAENLVNRAHSYATLANSMTRSELQQLVNEMQAFVSAVSK